MSSSESILLVDDDEDIRDTLRLVLEHAGYTVRTAANTSEARQALQQARPDLIVLDVMMTTDTEGFDFAYELRGRGDLTSIPIILLTSFLERVRAQGPDVFQHVLGEGWPADWLFEKPVNSDRLLGKIRSILGSA